MKKLFLYAAMVLLMLSGVAQATLTTIGTANYNGGTYNLIWDDDNNGNSLVWLDYTNAKNTWKAQRRWASSLDTELSVTWNAGVSVDWADTSWRLPNTVDGNVVAVSGYKGPDGNGNYDYTSGYNLSNSEMGHLYYEELGNLGYRDTDGSYPSDYGLKNTGEFNNLVDSWYWSGTRYSQDRFYAWSFVMRSGLQDFDRKTYNEYGLAVRSGQVSISLVPVPSAIILLGSGLVWVAGIGRKSRRDV